MAEDHGGHRERMRKRALEEGLMNFEDHELLEIMLYPFIPYKDTNEIAHALLNEFGSLENVFEADKSDLIKVKGVTNNACFYLSLLPQIFRRYNLSKLEKKPIMDTTKKLVEYFSPRLSTLTKEAIYMMTLDIKGALLGIKCVGTGVVNETYLHTRDIVEEAIKKNAVSVVIAHNHPSGNPYPSRADITITENIMTALESIGVALIDHLIICTNTYYSFSKHGGFDLLYSDYNKSNMNASTYYKNGEYDELYDLSQLDIEYDYDDNK